MLSVAGVFISVVDEWLQAQGYGASALSQRIRQVRPDHTIDVAEAEKFLAESAVISGDRLVALKIGALVRRAHLGPIGHMLASARTLEQLLNGYVYYESLFYGSNIANVRRSDLGMELYWAPSSVPEHYARFAISGFASAIEQMGLPRSSIVSVSFPFRGEENPDLYRNELGCGEVFFGRDLGLQFSGPSLQLSLINEEEGAAKRRAVKAILHEINDIEFAERLYDQVASALPLKQAKLSVIAKRMAVSERTLQRRVAPCPDGLRGIIKRVRMHLAREYLQDKGMNLLAASLLLGYSEQSALQLAFKRFYGISPGQWRKENRHGPA